MDTSTFIRGVGSRAAMRRSAGAKASVKSGGDHVPRGPGPSRSNAALAERFVGLAQACYEFSRQVASDASLPFAVALESSMRENLEIVRTVFGKWSMGILVSIYLNQVIGFQGLKKSLGPISSRVLSMKLRGLEAEGMIRREVAARNPPRTRYSLTPRGLIVSRLGEPVLLYLRLTGRRRRR